MPGRIYLDNAATSYPKPEPVIEAVAGYMRQVGSSPGRGNYRSALQAVSIMEQVRAALARLIGAAPAEVSLQPSATAALNLLLRSLLRPGDRVVTSSLEHNAVARPLRAAGREGVEVVKVPALRSDHDLDAWRRALSQPARAVVVSHGSNVTGAVAPLEEISRLCRQAGAYLVVDAAQSVGHLDIDVQAMGIDALAASGHKSLLGPPGTAFFYARPDLELQPLVRGGAGGRFDGDEQPGERPSCFESGTPNAPGFAGLLVALSWRRDEGEAALRARPRRWADLLLQELGKLDGVILYSTAAEERLPVLSFNLREWQPADLAVVLDAQWGIESRAGLHCAPWAHESLGTLDQGGSVRVSPGYFTTEAQIEELVRAVAQLLES